MRWHNACSAISRTELRSSPMTSQTARNAAMSICRTPRFLLSKPAHPARGPAEQLERRRPKCSPELTDHEEIEDRDAWHRRDRWRPRGRSAGAATS
ncbi:MAG: hypothetical protein GEV28_36915 [Actinophytocola sp.]|uniref:hypothetical protein n=1 Tax=Actinophytocola sp. TaxID=1872138 RepID=UPI0013292447|nr:hypothetical protein [Actinophytocola sp.]MPZ85666.1 hypothetical protein [Actinophytocola sp.]